MPNGLKHKKLKGGEKVENEKKPKKKKRLSEAGVIVIGALVGVIVCIGLACGFLYLMYRFFLQIDF